MILFPIWGAFGILMNRTQLESKQFKLRYGVFTQDIHTSSVGKAMFNIIYIVRRVLTALIIVSIDFPLAQCQLMVVLSTMNLIYLIVAKPVKEVFINRLEVFNEACVCVSSYMIV